MFEAFLHFLLHIYLCIQFLLLHAPKQNAGRVRCWFYLHWLTFVLPICLFMFCPTALFLPAPRCLLLFSTLFILLLSLTLVPTVLSPFANFLCLCLSGSFSWSGPMRGMTDQWSLNKTKDSSKPDSFLGPFYFFTFCAMNTFNCKLSSRSLYFVSSCLESK